MADLYKLKKKLEEDTSLLNDLSETNLEEAVKTFDDSRLSDDELATVSGGIDYNPKDNRML